MYFRRQLFLLFISSLKLINGIAEAKGRLEDNRNEDEWNIESEDSYHLMDKYSIRGFFDWGVDLSKLGTFSTRPKEKYETAGDKWLSELSSRKTSAYKNAFNDRLWTKQWYAQDYRTTDGPVMDLNLVPVYRMGYTGRGITVAVVDDGIKSNHPDLIDNLDNERSYDVIRNVKGAEPSSRFMLTPWWRNGHGTMCAGAIAMAANNSLCGVGVAYNAKLVGIRVLAKDWTPYSESVALSHGVEYVDIYSNSWGQPDDGHTMDDLGTLTNAAFVKGVVNGRGGKGSIYVFAGGNGRKKKDNCAADSYLNSPFTIGIAAASQRGKPSPYSEGCTAIMATAYSGGNLFLEDGLVPNDEEVVATGVGSLLDCVTDFSGTSAAAPLASGIIALTLEANNQLTYRDVMHLITMSSEVAPLANNENTWYRNGAGFWVSDDFGFGLLNAENMVLLAQQWKNVPKENVCHVSIYLGKPELLKVNQPVKVSQPTTACSGSDDEVNYLESIKLVSSVSHDYRGAIHIKVTSPAQTVSTLLEARKGDTSGDGLYEWTIKSVHNWGEDPKGTWIIDVEAKGDKCGDPTVGCVNGFELYFHGTAEAPQHHRNLPRTYSAFTLPNGETNLSPKKRI